MKRLISLALGLAAVAPLAAADNGNGNGNDNPNISNSTELHGKYAKHNADELAKLPANLRGIIERDAFFDAKISDVDKQTKNGHTYYKVSFKNEVRSWTSKYTDEGILVESTAKPNDWDDLPSAVQDALIQRAKDLGDAKIPAVWRESLDGKIVWKALLEKDGHGRLMVYADDGKQLELKQFEGKMGEKMGEMGDKMQKKMDDTKH